MNKKVIILRAFCLVVLKTSNMHLIFDDLLNILLLFKF